jgi:hypothetical protein
VLGRGADDLTADVQIVHTRKVPEHLLDDLRFRRCRRVVLVPGIDPIPDLNLLNRTIPLRRPEQRPRGEAG